MNVRWRQRTGWPSSLTEIRHRIGAFTRGDSPFKIGITCRPRTRASEYDRDEPYYDEMIVLHETSSIKNARDLEEELIKYYWGWCDNRNKGRGGNIGTPPHYAYIVVNHGRTPMTVRREQRTGWPGSLTEIRHRIGAFTRGGSPFKVGITCRPGTRASEYDRNEPHYDEMIVLYETSSIKNARDLEEQLIKYYWGRCDNRNRGRGGNIGTPPHYAYIVTSTRKR